MIHMAVSKKHMVYGYDLVRRFAYIKANIKLRHCDNRFLAGHGIADYIHIFDFTFANL